MAHYRDDLAWIHQAGFSDFARTAAPGVLAMLHAHGIDDGLIVEIGCGTGVLARALTDAGYDVLGVDASSAMIELARTTAPDARFEVSLFQRVTLPKCNAIIAMGEVLNHGTMNDIRKFIANASKALPPHGLLLFDVAERGAFPAHDEVRIGGDDWSVIIVKHSDGESLARIVTIFRNVDGVVRRDMEAHALALHARDELKEILHKRGFRVRVRRSYGSRRLPVGHAVYVASR